MKTEDLIKATHVLAITYEKSLTLEQCELWLSIFEYVPVTKFAHALQKHITDPDQGRFFPTPAHILGHMVLSKSVVKLRAEEEFDNNPCIDGTSSFDAQKESEFDRQRRRREHVAAQHDFWDRQPFERKLFYSDVISSTDIKLIENKPNRLGGDNGRI